MGKTTPSQTKIVVPSSISMVSLLGPRDEFLRVAEKEFDAEIYVRGNEITVIAEPDERILVEQLFDELIAVVRSGHGLTSDAIERSIAMLRAREAERPAEVLTLNILSNRGKTIRPKTLGQKRYVDAIDEHTIVFAIGPAGTGKTYLAMAKAVQALQAKRVNRIILTRPAVEAGERLGFLPGTLSEKIDPYLRPLYDALHDMIDPDSIPRLLTAGTIEVAPLAYMRGRAQPVFSKVLTPDGWRAIGDLRVGDLVVGSDGEPTPVLGVYPQGEKDIFRVTTQDGASTLATADHLWTVRAPEDRHRGRSWRVVTTEFLIESLRSDARSSKVPSWDSTDHRYELPLLRKPVCFPAQDVPLDPYALGHLLGSGRRAGSSGSTLDPALAEGLGQRVPGVEVRRPGERDVALGVSSEPGQVVTIADPVTAAVRELGLEDVRPETRFVPEAYLYNTADVRLAVLQGLLDTDGEPTSEQTGRIRYVTTSPRLRDDVLFLVRSLGGVASWRTGEANGDTPDGASLDVSSRYGVYALDISLPAGIEPFRLARKQQAYDRVGGGRPLRLIDRIESAGTAEAVCIQVAAADSLYVTEDFLLTHNTLNDAFIILDEAQNTSPEQMKMFLTRLGFGSKMVVTGDITQIDLPNGTFSGLKVVREILADLDDVHFCTLSSQDVVRHKLVGRIVAAYDKYEARRAEQDSGGAAAGSPDVRRRKQGPTRS